MIFGQALTAPRGGRGPWWAFFLFQSLVMAAQAIAILDQRLGTDVAFPGTAELVSLAAYLPAFVGLVLLIDRLRPGRDRESWIDASILTVTAICVFGLFLIAPALTTSLDGWAAVVVGLYPILDLALLSCLIWLLVGHGRPSGALALRGTVVRADASQRTPVGMPTSRPTRKPPCPRGRGSSWSRR